MGLGLLTRHLQAFGCLSIFLGTRKFQGEHSFLIDLHKKRLKHTHPCLQKRRSAECSTPSEDRIGRQQEPRVLWGGGEERGNKNCRLPYTQKHKASYAFAPVGSTFAESRHMKCLSLAQCHASRQEEWSSSSGRTHVSIAGAAASVACPCQERFVGRSLHAA